MFMDGSTVVTNVYLVSLQSNSTNFRISRRFPKECEQSECDYFVGINTNPENDDFLDFTLEGEAEGWVAVGFSNTSSMVRRKSFSVFSSPTFMLVSHSQTLSL